jgi:hypothetical protein
MRPTLRPAGGTGHLKNYVMTYVFCPLIPAACVEAGS